MQHTVVVAVFSVWDELTHLKCGAKNSIGEKLHFSDLGALLFVKMNSFKIKQTSIKLYLITLLLFRVKF